MELGENPREEHRSKIVNHGAIWRTPFHFYMFMLRLDLCDSNGLDVITALAASCAHGQSWHLLSLGTQPVDVITGQGNLVLIALPIEGLLK